MPSSLKSTSEPIAISTRLTQTTSNQFTLKRIDLQLNPLDLEVFVVTGVKIDFLNLPGHEPLGVALKSMPRYKAAVTKTQPASMPTIGSSGTVGFATIMSSAETLGTPPGSVISAVIESSSTDTPAADMDYLDIIATSDFFVCLDSFLTGVGELCDVAVRVHGYRARATAAQYAALVQSEQLSQ